MKTNEYRKMIADSFIECLKEDPLNWKKAWQAGKTRRPVNIATEKAYKGINMFYLKMMEEKMGYLDNRWATFNQIKDMGLKLKKGSEGAKVEYWVPYDSEEKRFITWDRYNEKVMSKSDQDKTEIYPRYYTVFNASQIEGVPKLIRKNENDNDIKADELLNRLSENMGIELTEDGGDSAFYNLETDTIHTPKKKHFNDSYSYAAVVLHEFIHATGHETRLNRDMLENRAYEELVAEIGSCFMGEYVKFTMSNEHLENHKAYVQGWIKGINDSPITLISAIRKAEEATDYLVEKGSLLTKEKEQTTEQETPVFDKLTPEKQTELSDSVKATLQTLIDADMKAHGEVTDGTLEAIRTQGYFYHDGELEKADPTAEPTITVVWSESSKVRDGQTMSLSEADKLFASLDAERHAEHGGSYYDKTAFRIDYVMNGKADSYGGRQDFGDGDGGLIAHIEKYHTYYADNPDWDNYLLRNKGKEALDADKAHREMLLNEFVPYLKMHTNLSEMEQAAKTAMQRGEELTQTEATYYTALQQYVSDCRGMLNQGNYEMPPVPQLADFDAELQAYKQHVREEIAQEAASAGMTVEEYAANGYEPYAAPEQTNEQNEKDDTVTFTQNKLPEEKTIESLHTKAEEKEKLPEV